MTGWDVDGDELRAHRPPHRRRQAPRSTCARAGRARRTACPERFLTEPLELDSGREATLTETRLTGMIDAYYVGRGLTAQGVPKPETETELGLDLFVQAP